MSGVGRGFRFRSARDGEEQRTENRKTRTERARRQGLKPGGFEAFFRSVKAPAPSDQGKRSKSRSLGSAEKRFARDDTQFLNAQDDTAGDCSWEPTGRAGRHTRRVRRTARPQRQTAESSEVCEHSFGKRPRSQCADRIPVKRDVYHRLQPSPASILGDRTQEI